MKSLLIYLFFFLCFFTCKAQNVGINSFPFLPLTVGVDATGVGIKQFNGSSELKLVSTSNQQISKLVASGNLHFATNGLTVPAMSLTSTGLAIGLSGTTASYLLDLKGRMRIQNDATNNLRPAIWFDGIVSSSPMRSAFEAINDNYFGIASSNAGYPFVGRQLKKTQS